MLGLYRRLHGAVCNLFKMLLHFGALIIFQNFIPRYFPVVLAKVGLHASRQDVDYGGLAHPVSSHQAYNGSFLWRRQAVEPERVYPVLVDLVLRQLFCKVDNNYSIKGAFLYADSAARAQVFGYDCLAILRALDDALTAGLVHWAVDDALQSAFPWLAQLLVKYRDPMRIFSFRIAQLHVIFATMRYIAMPNLAKAAEMGHSVSIQFFLVRRKVAAHLARIHAHFFRAQFNPYRERVAKFYDAVILQAVI